MAQAPQDFRCFTAADTDMKRGKDACVRDMTQLLAEKDVILEYECDV